MEESEINNVRKLLQERIDKDNPNRTLTAKEQRRLSNFYAIDAKLKLRANVQNPNLQTWLSEDEYAQIEDVWQEQLTY